jgi:hypothetical protein
VCATGLTDQIPTHGVCLLFLPFLHGCVLCRLVQGLAKEEFPARWRRSQPRAARFGVTGMSHLHMAYLTACFRTADVLRIHDACWAAVDMCDLRTENGSILVFRVYSTRQVLLHDVYDEVLMSFRSSELRRPASRTNS